MLSSFLLLLSGALSKVLSLVLAAGRATLLVSGEARADGPRRMDESAKQTPSADAVAVWDLLSDEHAMAVLSWCAPADLGRLSAVNQRLRGLALDERLWKAVYEATFPPCGPCCIATLGASVASLDIDALVDRALGLMFDPAEIIADCVLPLPESVSALGQVQRPQADGCSHHWIEVIDVRGYRWAHAVATVDRPRLFGPHLDGSSPCLVGRSVSPGGTVYRGDLVASRRGTYVAHGYATADAVQVVPRDSAQEHALVARGPSGRWAHGKLSGRAVAWCGSPRPDSRLMSNEPRNWCVGFYLGLWVDGRQHGAGILMAPDYPYPRTRCGAPSMVRHGSWDSGRFGYPARAWSVVAHENHPNAGIGILETSGETQKTGIVRAADGRVAFVGSVRPWYPVVGRLMAHDGSVIYDGDVCVSHEKRRGRLFLSESRCAVTLAGWTGRLDRRPPPHELRHDRGTPTITIAYANGDQMRWHDNPASPAVFVYADGRMCRPPLGWEMAPCYPPRGNLADGSVTRPLIQDTPFALCETEGIIAARDSIRDLAFWPRLGDPDSIPTYTEFLDHMAIHHGPLWVRCRAAVRLLWGLDGIPAAPSP